MYAKINIVQGMVIYITHTKFKINQKHHCFYTQNAFNQGSV